MGKKWSEVKRFVWENYHIVGAIGVAILLGWVLL